MTSRLQQLQRGLKEHAETLRSEGAISEQKQEFSQVSARILRDLQLFHMYRPQSLGGLGMRPTEVFQVIETLVHYDSAAAWNVALANGWDVFGAWFPEETSRDIFGDPLTIVSGSTAAPLKGTRVEGGLRVSGSTPLNSNCVAATWFIFESLVVDDGNEREDETCLVIVPTEDVRSLENWSSLGMRGTGSHTVAVNNAFVPEARTVELESLPAPNKYYEGALSRQTIWPATIMHGITALGVAQCALEDSYELVQNKREPGTQNLLLHSETVQLRLGTAEACIRAARSLVNETYAEAWRIAESGDFLSQQQKADCQLAASFLIKSCNEAIEHIAACCGSAAFQTNYMFERHFRDFQTIRQHADVTSDRLRSVAEVRLGLEPSWELLSY